MFEAISEKSQFFQNFDKKNFKFYFKSELPMFSEFFVVHASLA